MRRGTLEAGGSQGGSEGSWEPASTAVVLSRHDVSAVLCGPGEQGWAPRRGATDRATRPGAQAQTRACTPNPPLKVGRVVDLSGLTPLLLGLVSRARARRSAVGETLSAGGREGKRGSQRGYPEIFGSGLKDFA